MSTPPGPVPPPPSSSGAGDHEHESAQAANGRHPTGHGPQNPHSYPPNQPPPHPAPPRNRPKWVPIVAAIAIIALVLGGIAATLSYLAAERDRRAAEELERQQTEEANEAAAEFFTALEVHEEIWSQEVVRATYGTDVAATFSPLNIEADDQSEPIADLAQACADQGEAVEAFTALEGSTRPTLEEVSGTSDSYRSAQSAARASAQLAEAEEEYLGEGRGLAGQVLTYCEAWSQQAGTIDSERSAYNERLEAVLVPQGQSQSEDNWTVDCSQAEGCLPLVRADREEYAEATTDFYKVLFEAKSTLFTDHCLDGYDAYCELEIAFAQAERDAARAAMDLLRGPLGSGSEALPGYNEALEEWQQEVESRRADRASLLTEMDTEVARNVAEHFAAHQQVVVGSWQERISELAGATLDRHRADRA